MGTRKGTEASKVRGKENGGFLRVDFQVNIGLELINRERGDKVVMAGRDARETGGGAGYVFSKHRGAGGRRGKSRGEHSSRKL